MGLTQPSPVAEVTGSPTADDREDAQAEGSRCGESRRVHARMAGAGHPATVAESRTCCCRLHMSAIDQARSITVPALSSRNAQTRIDTKNSLTELPCELLRQGLLGSARGWS